MSFDFNLKHIFLSLHMFRFEGGGQSGDRKDGIEGHPTLVEVADVFSMQTTLGWFDMLLAALDCYSWAFGESLLTPTEVFGSKKFSFLFNYIVLLALLDKVQQSFWDGVLSGVCCPASGVHKSLLSLLLWNYWTDQTVTLKEHLYYGLDTHPWFLSPQSLRWVLWGSQIIRQIHVYKKM